MPRIATVRQRCLIALYNKLKSINQENGYNTNIRDVIFTRDIGQQPQKPDIIKVVILETDKDYSANTRDWETVNMELHWYKQKTTDQELEYDLYVGDVYEALKNTLVDETHPNPNNTGIWMEYVKDVPAYNLPGQNTVGGWLEYNMRFYYSQNNNRLWDDQEDREVEIEE